MKIYMIRHGMTRGNTEQRYVGKTDEELSDYGRVHLKELVNIMPGCFHMGEHSRGFTVYGSDMKRCIQTAGILYPYAEYVPVHELRECDFGEFEYKNYCELNGNPAYQAYIDSGGMAPFPGGEKMTEFVERCVRGFDSILQECDAEKDIIMVVHGGTIMAVLGNYAYPHREYFEWQTSNGQGYSMKPVREDGQLRLVNVEKFGVYGGEDINV